MTYNWLTGKCDYNTFSGFTPPDCYSPCSHIAVPDVVPAEIIEFEGQYYYDTKRCEPGFLESVFSTSPLTRDVNEGTVFEQLGTAIVTGGMADSNLTALQKELV